MSPGLGDAVGDEWLEKDSCDSSPSPSSSSASVSFLSASDDVDIRPLYLKHLQKFEGFLFFYLKLGSSCSTGVEHAPAEKNT